jgi:uroporphyrinogen-III synthase
VAIAVLTRVPVDAYARALAPLGVEVVAMEVTRQLATPEDMRATARAIRSGPFAATLVASRAAATWLRSGAIAIDASGIARTPSFELAKLGEIWAVGPATLHALGEELDVPDDPAGIGRPWHARHPDGVTTAAELARALLASRSFAGERVLIPRAEDGRTEAIELLRAAGVIVVDVVAYRTAPVAAGEPTLVAGRDLLAAGRATACCVFAPSQVSALIAISGPLAALDTQFVAIGDTTAAALRDAGVTPVVAASPTPDGLAQAIALHLRPA